jgi:hypothetical protein
MMEFGAGGLTMRTVCSVFAVGVCLLAGCSAGPSAAVGTPAASSSSLTVDEVSAAVKQSIQQDFARGDQICTNHLQVEQVVVHAVGNAYQGTVTVRTPKGTLHDVAIQVSQQGAKITWLAPPGAFAFAVTDGAMPAGTPVRDGPLEFVVHGVRRATVARDATNGADQVTAKGEFVIVDLTVTNVGDWAQAYDAPRQQLLVDCTPYTAAPLAMLYLTPAAKRPIDPGVSVEVQTPFDVPPGSVPEVVHLVAATDSSGIFVDLAGLPMPPP